MKKKITEVFNLKQAAAYLGISVPTLAALLRSGEIPCRRAGQRWLDMGYDFRSWTNIWYLSPKGYREVLRRMKELCDRMPESSYARKLIMIDNWNEWDEGHFVAPSHKFGFQYLQAIREALTECDNLPDYRMPHDQGFEDYNTSWTTADFSGFLKKTDP